MIETKKDVITPPVEARLGLVEARLGLVEARLAVRPTRLGYGKDTRLM